MFESSANPGPGSFPYQQSGQQIFYGAASNTNAVTAPGSSDGDTHHLPTDPEFRTAFRYFLFNFTLNGETVYKDKIRNLDLLISRDPPATGGVGLATTRSMPSICLDLEHLSMPHWLAASSGANAPHSASADEGLEGSQISAEDDAYNRDYSYDDDSHPHPSRRSGWGDMLTLSLRQQPLHFLSVAEQCIRELYIELLGGNSSSASPNDPAHPSHQPLSLFQLELVSRQKPSRIGELTAAAVETLVTLPGIVVQAYRPQHKAVKIKVRCRQCEHEQWLNAPLWRQGIELPRICAAGGNRAGTPTELRCPLDPYVVLSDESEFCDVQTVKIQELPEQVPTGDMPRHIVLHAANVLCGRVAPGQRILVAGVYSVQHKAGGATGTASGDSGVQTSYIHALGLSRLDGASRGGVGRSVGASSTGGSWSFQQEEEFQRMARDPQIHEQIFRSIAPSLFGLDDIKKSVACLLFGGSSKFLPDGSRLRGDINILLLGDPSTAKSQFLKFVERVAPIAVYTSGKGSSAAGLTAAVIRDSNRNFALEGGAMVLADGGVVCIDEFDKMRDDDRVAIHEAMEQQTISIAKAGITTVLTTRCSVLAAANPSFGSYDDTKDTTEQHDFETTILSRFDLIWLVRDTKSAERDQMIARHIVELHSGSGRTVQADGPIPIPKLRSYIAYCRSVCDPVLSEDAAKKLENFYVEVRESMRQGSRKNKRDQIPVTVRQLESLCRIAESLAKMSLGRFVTADHVQQAIQLFKLSTVEAAKGGLARETMSETERDRVRAAEALILQRLPVNGKASKTSILRDLKLRGYDTAYTGQAIRMLVQKGTLEERGDAAVKRVALGDTYN